LGNYFAIVTCRNSEINIMDSLNSLKKQSLQAEYVIVINDGSTDRTAEILSDIQKDWNNLYVINHPDWGYDIKRVVKNWNEAIKLTHDKALQKTTHHMISYLDAF
jgi:glycosyltransferase involved in cell wall biosynthesis